MFPVTVFRTKNSGLLDTATSVVARCAKVERVVFPEVLQVRVRQLPMHIEIIKTIADR